MSSTRITVTKAPTKFLSLPFEIRNTIYRHCLANRSFIVVTSTTFFEGDDDSTNHLRIVFNGGLCTALLRTSHQVYDEARIVLYAENLIHFSIFPIICLDLDWNYTVLAQFISRTSKENLSLIKHAALHPLSIHELLILFEKSSTDWPMGSLETLAIIKIQPRPAGAFFTDMDGVVKTLHAAMEVCPSLQTITGDPVSRASSEDRGQGWSCDRVVVHNGEKKVEQWVEARLDVLEAVSLYKEFVHGRWHVPDHGYMESENDKDWKGDLFFESLSCGQEDLSD